MKFRWSIAPPQALPAQALTSFLTLSPLLAQCLLNRGLTSPGEIARFLEPRLKDLADPFLLPDMMAAVERLLQALQHNEALVIFGDYDVDGVTSTALLLKFLRSLGWRVDFYLPHRFDEGYGLTQEAVEKCLIKFSPALLLAVDCGSTAGATIAWLKERGVDTIVLDHHQISSPPPAAVALVNPRAGGYGGECAFTELCSAGLAFKLIHAVIKRARELGWPNFLEYDLRVFLDLVALGTIADIVPLVGENRILVSAGLRQLNRTQRPGLIALKTVAQTAGTMGCYEVGFQLAPRLNAAGRLETAEDALRLVLTDDLAEATELARRLDAHNRERRQIERAICDEVLQSVRARFRSETDFVIVEGKLLWHIGVVGIVASRVLQEFYRPTIIVGGEGEEWRGSGRSIEGFDLAGALRECSDLLIRHGGHSMAAGVTIHSSNLDAFRARLNEVARKTLAGGNLRPVLKIDAEISLGDLTLESLGELQRMSPHGPGNPAPHFVIRGLQHQRPPQRMGKENQHVKFRVTDGHEMREAVFWNCGPDGALPDATFDLAVNPQINEFNGRRTVQLKVLDWSASEPV
jgi:single-stranded-DNA-specific exonuclease